MPISSIAMQTLYATRRCFLTRVEVLAWLLTTIRSVLRAIKSYEVEAGRQAGILTKNSNADKVLGTNLVNAASALAHGDSVDPFSSSIAMRLYCR